jgi:hypothetical protein
MKTVLVCIFTFSSLVLFAQNKKEEKVKILDAEIDKNFVPNADLNYGIDSVKLSGDILTMYIKYSGGGKTHKFSLVTNYELSKTNPPQIEVHLVNDTKGDKSFNIIPKTLKFDLTPLRYSDSKAIVVKLDNNKKFKYSYKHKGEAESKY